MLKHTATILCVCYSGTRGYSGGADGAVVVWDLDQTSKAKPPKIDPDAPSSEVDPLEKRQRVDFLQASEAHAPW